MGVTQHSDMIPAHHGERMRAAMLDAGLALWRDDPASVSARRIGKIVGLTHGGVLYHFGTSAALRDAIAAHAVAARDPVVIPLLIASRHAAASSLTASQRAGYLASVAG